MVKRESLKSLQLSVNASPVPGKAVYIKQTNKIWVFSFSRNSQADNKLYSIDLNNSFNSLSTPVIDLSTRITSDQCPVLHFAQALPDADGVSINIFGAGSVNNIYDEIVDICQYNTVTNVWKQIRTSGLTTFARRNAAFEVTHSNLTFIFGGSSEPITGLSTNSIYYPNYWHQEVSVYDSRNQQWLNTGLSYDGYTRANATITQISDTNGQLVILGGSLINNSSSVDMVTNFPLASMSDIVVLDPRTSKWTNITATGNALPPPRKHHTTTLHPDGHTLITIGGEYFNSTGAYLLNDVWTLDTSDMNNYVWKQPDISGVGLYRSNHTSILIDDVIWVIAGTNASAKAVDIQLLNVTSWTWSYAHVSTYHPSSDSFSSIGGVKGLIGIIVGTVVGVSILVALAVFLWCHRKRVKPSKNNQGSLALPMDPQDYSYHDMSLSVDSNNKSRPSESTTSNPNIGEWNSGHPMLSNSPLHKNSISFNQLQYSNSPPLAAGMDRGHFYEENYHLDNNYNSNIGPYQTIDSAPMMPIYNPTSNSNNDISNHRLSLGYWDSLPPPLQIHQPLAQIEDSYILTPLGQSQENSQRPISKMFKAQPQHLQKPNEADNASPQTPGMSGTVYTASSNEENVSKANSDDLLHN